MAFGQQVAQRVKETVLNVNSTEWMLLEGSPVLDKRFAVEVYNRSDRKVFLTYDNTSDIRAVKAIGPSETKVEPAQDSLNLYGRCAAGTARVIVTEYGHGI
jgi:hypothetical protein